MTENKRFTSSEDIGCLDVPCSNIHDKGEFIGTVILSDVEQLCDLLNGQDKEIRTLANQLSVADDTIEDLLNEIEQLKTQLVNSVFVDMDNGNGCYNCKWDSGGICEKLMKGSLGYIKEVSWCNLKHWELLE